VLIFPPNILIRNSEHYILPPSIEFALEFAQPSSRTPGIATGDVSGGGETKGREWSEEDAGYYEEEGMLWPV
jgi:hypothetical protein